LAPLRDKGIAFSQLDRLEMSHQEDPKARSPPPNAAHNSAFDSGIDPGSSSEFDQENNAHHALEAQDDTSEYSTDEG